MGNGPMLGAAFNHLESEVKPRTVEKNGSAVLLGNIFIPLLRYHCIPYITHIYQVLQ